MGAIRQWLNHYIAKIKPPLSTGAEAEAMASGYLKSQGLKLVAMNYFTKAGEIDLIMREGKQWVFVEVKHRSASDWSSAAESVTYAKQRKVIKAAKQYLQQRKLFDQVDCRFDVIAIDGELVAENIQWLQHAFD